MQYFAAQQPRSAWNAGRFALPPVVALAGHFASVEKSQTARHASADVSAHSRDAESCSIEETSSESGQRASGAFASRRPCLTVL